MSRHREDEVSIRPFREAPEWMEAATIRENLVRMLRCIGHLQSVRRGRKTILVPGSAVFDKNKVAELTFYRDPAGEQVDNPSTEGDEDMHDDDGEEEGLFVALPEVAQPFATLLAVEALWLDRSERLGEAVENTLPLRVLDPVVIDVMLREKRYLTWSVQDATEFAMNIPFEPLERGDWYDTETVSEWKEHVQYFRARQFLASLFVAGAIETWPLTTYLDRPLFLDTNTVTYDCLKRQDKRRGADVDGWPLDVEIVPPDQGL